MCLGTIAGPGELAGGMKPRRSNLKGLQQGDYRVLNVSSARRFLERRGRPALLSTSESVCPRLDRHGFKRLGIQRFGNRRLGAKPKNIRHRNDAIARIDLLQLSKLGRAEPIWGASAHCSLRRVLFET